MHPCMSTLLRQTIIFYIKELLYNIFIIVNDNDDMTFYYFSHLLQTCLLPPGINCVFILLGILLLFFSLLLGMVVVIIGFLSLYLLSMPIVAYNMINYLQDQYTILQESDLMPKEQFAIVVLGGGNTVEKEYNNKLTISDATLHRVRY